MATFNNNINNTRLYNNLLIIQHNVHTWTDERAIELSNYYNLHNPDIILLNSVSLRQGKAVKIFNYNVYERNYLNEFQAGIAIAIKKNIQHKVLDNFQDDILGIRIETNKGPIEIYTIYSPPRRNYLPIGEINSIAQKNIPTYLIGDVNAQHQMLTYTYVNTKGRIIKNYVDNNKLKHFGPDFPTLVRRNGRPDIVLGNRWAHLNMAISPGSLTSSDHLPVHVKLSTNAIIKDIKKVYNFKKANWDKYKNTIENQTEIKNMNNKTKEEIDEEIRRWMETITKAADESIPKNKVTFLIKPNNSDNLKLLMNQYQQLRTLPSWNINQLNTIRNIQHQLKTESMKLYNEMWSAKISKLQETYRDPKEFWAEVRRMMGGGQAEAPYIINNAGEKLHTNGEKELEFQYIWKNIFRINPQDNVLFDITHENYINNYLNIHEFEITPFEKTDCDRLDNDNYLIRPVTNNDIKQTIKDFKHKAPGQSGINKILLLNIPEIAITKYRDILNATISMGYFPIVLKNGIIVLIPKPNKEATNPLNYRPITLLELPGKILERIINSRFQRYCEENEIFHKNQYGFRKGKGTDVAITKIYETIAINQKYKDHCNIVCRDISKAFDKIWLNGLKYKMLRQNDLPSLMKKIVTSYVSDRTAQIRIGNHLGNRFNLESGVPQGGILSPTLFIFYTSDIPRAGPNSEDVIFADDITQIIQNLEGNKEQLKMDTEREIDRVNSYEKRWKIMTNTTKFKIMSVSKTRPLQIEVDNRLRPFANECNILGLKLKRTGTVSHITDRIRSAKNQTQRLKRFINLNEKTKSHLYKALIRPVLEYPVVPNVNASKSQMKKMQRVQNRNLKMIAKNTENENKTIKELHEIYGYEPINIRLFCAAEKLWHKFQAKEPEIQNRSQIENRNRKRDHSWWPRTAKKLSRGLPPPIYT